MKATEAKAPKQPVILEPCCVCGKKVEGFYGRWGKSGTCSKSCEQVQESKSKFFFDGRQ